MDSRRSGEGGSARRGGRGSGRSAQHGRRYVAEGRLHDDRTPGAATASCSRGRGLARGARLADGLTNDSEAAEEEEVFEGEVSGTSLRGHLASSGGSFERYERLLQQARTTRRARGAHRPDRGCSQGGDAARTEIDRLWEREIERLNSSSSRASCKRGHLTLEEEKARLESNAERLVQEKSSSSKRNLPSTRAHTHRSRAKRPQEPRLLVAPLRRLKQRTPFPSPPRLFRNDG